VKNNRKVQKRMQFTSKVTLAALQDMAHINNVKLRSIAPCSFPVSFVVRLCED